jgi:hypothetical protein
MKKLMIFPLILLALALSACGAIRGSGDVTTETREVSGFNAVNLAGIGELILTQGDEASLQVEAEDNLMRYLETEVRGDTLVLGIKESWRMNSIWPTKPIKFYVTLKDITAVTITGSGSARAEKLEATNLELNVYGSGDIQVDEVNAKRAKVNLTGSGNIEVDTLTADEVHTSISGSGECRLSGEVSQQELHITGSGDYLAKKLASQMADVTVSGSGGSTLWVTDTLEVRLSGSGDVKYYGEPQVSKNISGSGHVKGQDAP